MANQTDIISIAIDDVDSPNGGCTTHFTGLLLHTLLSKPGVELVDYPLLVRLNPGIPWKTRGNAATVLRLRGVETRDLVETVSWLLAEYTLDRPAEPGKGPGFAVVTGNPWQKQLRLLYRMALTGVVTRDLAVAAVERIGGLVSGERGVIGASSALGSLSPWDDYTYELIYYRRPENWGEPRCVKKTSEHWIPPCTFNNASGKLPVAAPRGPDPVLAGFRGDCPEKLHIYREWLCEEPHFWVLYRTNQHTDAPAIIGAPRRPHPYNYYFGWVKVLSKPKRLPGGHTIVEAKLAGYQIRSPLAFYRESWPLNEAASRLIPGDTLWIMGSSRPHSGGTTPTIAVDKMRIARLARQTRTVSPLCPRCGHRMKSAGRGKGYRCPRCGYYDPNAKPLTIEIPRNIGPGWYAPREGRIRHLVSPPDRRPATRIAINQPVSPEAVIGSTTIYP